MGIGIRNVSSGARRRTVALAAAASILSLSLQAAHVPASAAGTIDLSVGWDLSACGSMSFDSDQTAIFGTLTSQGAGTTNSGAPAPIAGVDSQTLNNASGISLCVPGIVNPAGGSATYELQVQAVDPQGLVTAGVATVSCVYTNGLGLVCSPTARVVIPPSRTT